MKKNPLLTGTLVLTLAGLLTRIMGFFYKIYLSNSMTTESLGLYQMIFPVYGICFTLYASGIQTAISQLVANSLASTSKTSSHHPKNILRCGMVLSASIAFLLSFIVFTGSDFIAIRFLMEPRCSLSLRILSVMFPFCGITACINGYYYGLKKTRIPASTQLLEQVVRIGSVYFLAVYLGNGNKMITCELAAFGIVLGEIASDLYSVSSFFLDERHSSKKKKSSHENPPLEKYKVPSPFGKLTALAIPLTANRLVISLLHSFEAVLVPFTLQKSGLSTSESLSIYGVLSGMAMPFILFPSAITNALAILLLPTISEAQAAGNMKKIQAMGQLTIKCSLIIGIFATYIFISFGNALGNVFFHNESAGYFIIILAWLCPFMYLSTTFGSIINGLGKTHLTFLTTTVSLGIKILLLCILIPRQGINGYLISLLASQLILTLLDYLVIIKMVPLPIDAVNCIGKPISILCILGFIFIQLYENLMLLQQITPLVLLLSVCLMLCICYIGMLFLTKAISREELTL